MLTGWGHRLIATDDKPEHVDRVLSKPPKMAELRATLAELARRARSTERCRLVDAAAIVEGNDLFLAALARAGDLRVQPGRRYAGIRRAWGNRAADSRSAPSRAPDAVSRNGVGAWPSSTATKLVTPSRVSMRMNSNSRGLAALDGAADTQHHVAFGRQPELLDAAGRRSPSTSGRSASRSAALGGSSAAADARPWRTDSSAASAAMMSGLHGPDFAPLSPRGA